MDSSASRPLKWTNCLLQTFLHRGRSFGLRSWRCSIEHNWVCPGWVEAMDGIQNLGARWHVGRGWSEIISDYGSDTWRRYVFKKKCLFHVLTIKINWEYWPYVKLIFSTLTLPLSSTTNSTGFFYLLPWQIFGISIFLDFWRILKSSVCEWLEDIWFLLSVNITFLFFDSDRFLKPFSTQNFVNIFLCIMHFIVKFLRSSHEGTTRIVSM